MDVHGLPLPRVGRTYVLFLRRQAGLEAFHVVTAYNITYGTLSSLDSPDHYPAFPDVPMPEFIDMVRARLDERREHEAGR